SNTGVSSFDMQGQSLGIQPPFGLMRQKPENRPCLALEIIDFWTLVPNGGCILRLCTSIATLGSPASTCKVKVWGSNLRLASCVKNQKIDHAWRWRLSTFVRWDQSEVASSDFDVA